VRIISALDYGKVTSYPDKKQGIVMPLDCPLFAAMARQPVA